VVDLAELGDTLPRRSHSDNLAEAIEASERDRDVKFTIRYTSPLADQEFQEEIGLIVDSLWTGLRRTPATNGLIENCIKKFCEFVAIFLADSSEWDS
jgi:hypothetical protein